MDTTKTQEAKELFNKFMVLYHTKGKSAMSNLWITKRRLNRKLESMLADITKPINTEENAFIIEGIKEVCKKCYYWTGKGRAYKCYGGDCPAKKRDETNKEKRLLQRRSIKPHQKRGIKPK